MIQKNKNTWSRFAFHVGLYTIESVKQVMLKVEMFKVYQLNDPSFYGHDIEGFIKRYCNKYNIPWAYTHCTCMQEEI